MGNGFWIALGQVCQVCFWTVRYLPRGKWRLLPRRTLLFGLMIPILLFFQMLHWIGFAIDELLFHRYRSVKVVRPIFVTGIPRSGTTHLQRVLAKHGQLTSMQTWECVFAPSISERYVYRVLGFVFSPLLHVTSRIKLPFLNEMKSIHALKLTEAEEDFITLLPINACFLMVILFPSVDQYWQLSEFDNQVPENKRKNIMNFYARMVQKHLYFHGNEKRYLCKNPSFLTWMRSIKTQYPDADFIVCERPADQAVPSQLSSLEPSWRMVYGEPMFDEFSDRIVNMLAAYYHYIDGLEWQTLNALSMPMNRLSSDLDEAIKTVLSHCSLVEDVEFLIQLDQEVRAAKRYRSQHQYSRDVAINWSDQAGLFPEDIRDGLLLEKADL